MEHLIGYCTETNLPNIQPCFLGRGDLQLVFSRPFDMGGHLKPCGLVDALGDLRVGALQEGQKLFTIRTTHHRNFFSLKIVQTVSQKTKSFFRKRNGVAYSILLRAQN